MKAVYTHGALTTTRKQVIDICLLIHLGQHFNIKKKKSLIQKGTLYMYTFVCTPQLKLTSLEVKMVITKLHIFPLKFLQGAYCKEQLVCFFVRSQQPQNHSPWKRNKSDREKPLTTDTENVCFP